MTACLEFAKSHLKTVRLSETRFYGLIELFGLNTKCYVWRKPGNIPTVKHGGGSIMVWEYFSAAGTGRLVRIEAKINGAKVHENLLQSAQDLRPGQRFTFQQDNIPKHTAKTGVASGQVSECH
jgi:hypothetical protein